MNKLKAKLKKQGGFTLVEMLIVIGIIGILIAVSIPAVSNALEGAKHATDAANERTAKAVMLIDYVNGDVSAPATKYYNAKSGKMQGDLTGVDAYGKHKAHKYLRVTLNADGTVTETWCISTSSLCGDGLCSEKELSHTP